MVIWLSGQEQMPKLASKKYILLSKVTDTKEHKVHLEISQARLLDKTLPVVSLISNIS